MINNKVYGIDEMKHLGAKMYMFLNISNQSFHCPVCNI